MSRKLYITLFFVFVLLTGCNEVDYTLYPEGYLRILSIKGAGVRYCHSGNTVTEYRDSLLVLKGGGEPDSDAFASLDVMTIEEACKAFGYTADMIEIVPENTFSITGSDNISLPGDLRSRYIPLIFSPTAIYERGLQVRDKILVLPLELKSDTDTVNAASNKVLYRFDINGPVLEWEDGSDAIVQIDFQSTDLKLGVKVSYHESSLDGFTCGVASEGLNELVAAYNRDHDTSYELLPEQAYSFEPFAVSAKAQRAESMLNLTRDGLVSDKRYLLPLKLEREGMPIEVSSVVKYLIVTNPKFSYREVDRTDWKIAFANCTEKPQDWRVDCMLDGNPSSTWGTNWSAPLAQEGYDDYLYENSSDKILHMLDRRRDVGDVVVVIDMGRSVTVGRIGFSKSDLDFPNNQDLKACEFYVTDTFTFKPIKMGGTWDNYQTANEGNDWRMILEIKDIPKEIGTFWYDVPSDVSVADRTGRYVKMHPTQVYRGLDACQMAEFFVAEIVAIDGKAINQ